MDSTSIGAVEFRDVNKCVRGKLYIPLSSPMSGISSWGEGGKAREERGSWEQQKEREKRAGKEKQRKRQRREREREG